MEQRNCKNCGAPLEHGYNHKCKYCGTLYDFNAPKDEVVEFKSYDMINLKYRGIERDIITRNLIMKFEGLKLEAPVVYEADENKKFISKSINYINPPKSYFFISISVDELENYGMSYLDYILDSYIRPTEIANVKKQLQEHCADFSKYGIYIMGLNCI